jgi:hypothetical protein
VCVDTKSSGSFVDASSWSTQPAAADDGPPTRNPSSTDFTARTATSCRRKNSSGVPDQKTSRLASFHTSNAHRSRTSSRP